MRGRPERERFWRKVNKHGPTPSDNPSLGVCWLWTGWVHQLYGYGIYNPARGKHYRAHRYAYIDTFGPIPDGLVVDHLCRNRACVNPAHLEAVTQRTNVLRSRNHVAQLATQTHCKRGHEFTVSNTYRTPQGERKCRICTREINRRAVRRYNERKRLRRASQGVVDA